MAVAQIWAVSEVEESQVWPPLNLKDSSVSTTPARSYANEVSTEPPIFTLEDSVCLTLSSRLILSVAEPAKPGMPVLPSAKVAGCQSDVPKVGWPFGMKVWSGASL